MPRSLFPSRDGGDDASRQNEVVEDTDQQYSVDDGTGGADGGSADDDAPSTVALRAATEALQQVQQNKGLAELLAIPGVREAYQAHLSGKKVHVMDDEQMNQRTQPAEEQEPNWEELSQDPKKFSAFMRKSIIGDVIKTVDGTLRENLKPLIEKVNSVEGETRNRKVQEAQTQIAAALKKYPDMPKYKNLMTQLHQENPGLDVEELYHLSRRRAGHAPISADERRGVQSERPTHTTARPPMKQNSNQGKPGQPNKVVGRPGFRDALSSAMQGMEFPEFDELPER